jgi:hypothetical protein
MAETKINAMKQGDIWESSLHNRTSLKSGMNRAGPPDEAQRAASNQPRPQPNAEAWEQDPQKPQGLKGRPNLWIRLVIFAEPKDKKMAERCLSTVALTNAENVQRDVRGLVPARLSAFNSASASSQFARSCPCWRPFLM